MVVKVDELVGFSSIPCEEELLKKLASEFNGVVVLVEDWELCYDLSFWNSRGVDVLWYPVEDFRSPGIVGLHRIVEWIIGKTKLGERVLVHCYGGLGRSGVVVAAYLVSKYGYGWRESIDYVRSIRPGAIESIEQVSVLRVYHHILRVLGRRVLSKIISFGQKYRWGGGLWNEKHASKVAQLAVRLWEDINQYMNLGEDSLKPLAVASLLHDIGRSNEDEYMDHAVTGMHIIRNSEELKKILDEETIAMSACLVKHHRTKPLKTPLEDYDCPSKRGINVLAGILKIADGLDYALNQSVLEVSVRFSEDSMKVITVCKDDCMISIEKAGEKAWLLERALNKKVRILHQDVE